MIKKFIAFTSVFVMFSMTSLVAFADSTSPSDVENLKGVAGDGLVNLSWDPATDDVGVVGYEIYWGESSVTEPGQSYDNNLDVGNVLEYRLEGLTNNVNYYFSVIAYDEARNESEAWATELMLRPLAGDADNVPPQVISAEAISKDQVKIVFSESVSLPEENPEREFSIENQDTFELLEVLSAMMFEEDETNSSVILETETQILGNEYKLTVNIGVKDLAGNNIISGTSDTALFSGSDTERAVVDTTGPRLLSAEALDDEHIVVQFDEAIVLSLDPSENFVIVEKNDANVKLSVLGVDLGTSDAGVENASALIRTGKQRGVEYIVSAINVLDESGNSSRVSESTITIIGKGDAPTDPVDPSPEDPIDQPSTPAVLVAKFMAKTVFENDAMVVKLSWDILSETKDLIEAQKIYMSKNSDKNFSLKDSIGPTETSYDVVGLDAGDYWFKITTLDIDGNESEGLVTGKIRIAETGPSVIGLLMLSIGLGGVIKRKKRV